MGQILPAAAAKDLAARTTGVTIFHRRSNSFYRTNIIRPLSPHSKQPMSGRPIRRGVP